MNRICIFLSFSIIVSFFISCGEDDTNQGPPFVQENVLTWSFNGQDYQVIQDSLNAIMRFSSDARVHTLEIVARSEQGNQLTLYVQELFSGGIGSCLNIESFSAVIDENECFDDGFLVICDGAACDYDLSDGSKLRSFEKDGFINISACDDPARSISGDFSLLINTDQNAEDGTRITGEFNDLIYVWEE